MDDRTVSGQQREIPFIDCAIETIGKLCTQRASLIGQVMIGEFLMFWYDHFDFLKFPTFAVFFYPFETNGIMPFIVRQTDSIPSINYANWLKAIMCFHQSV